MTRRDTNIFLDNIITENIQPRTPKTGIGLNISVGRKRKVLVNPRSELTPADKYYSHQNPSTSHKFHKERDGV